MVDHRLVGSLHVDLARRAEATTLADGDAAFQTSTIESLLDGAYEGDLTIGELLAHGDLGIGTVDHLDGELVVVDGEAFVVRGDGSVEVVAPTTGTPFAVVCHLGDAPPLELAGFDELAGLTAAIDAVAPDGDVLAVRVDAEVERAVVRSVVRQHRPYPPLSEVVAHQHEWVLTDVAASIVGFRFPDATGGLEVPGWHLHLLAQDRSCGGHVVDVAADGVMLRCTATSSLHVEVPSALGLVRTDVADRGDEISAVEGRRRS